MRYRIFAILLIIAILSSGFILPQRTSAAGFTQVAFDYGVCITSNTAGNYFAPILKKQIDNITNLLSGLGINIAGGSLPGGINPAGGNVVPVFDQKYYDTYVQKITTTDPLARCLANAVMEAMIGNIGNQVNSYGRDGGAAWVKNWRNFQTDSEYRGEGIFRAMLSTANLCPYMANDLKSIFSATQPLTLPGVNTRTGSLDPFSLRMSCTLPSGFNIDSYQKDFAGNGGWQTLVRMGNSQNNIYGALFNAIDELNSQKAIEVSADTNEAVSGQGFTSKRGPDTGGLNNCIIKDNYLNCLAYKDVSTPGIILKDSVSATIQQRFAWMTNVHALSDFISDAVSNLFYNLADLSNQSGWTSSQPVNVPTPNASSGPTASPPADALIKHPDTGAVATAKSQLAATGETFSGSCGSFKIINLAAWNMGNGAGLVKKSSGHRCEVNSVGYSVDVIMYSDGYAYDVLIGSSDPGIIGQNGPAWQPLALIAPSSYAPPINPSTLTGATFVDF